MMPHEVSEIRYATGEIALVGDCVDNDGCKAVVKDVIASSDDMARWGLDKSGLMLKSEVCGLVFQPFSSVDWDALIFQGRSS